MEAELEESDVNTVEEIEGTNKIVQVSEDTKLKSGNSFTVSCINISIFF